MTIRLFNESPRSLQPDNAGRVGCLTYPAGTNSARVGCTGFAGVRRWRGSNRVTSTNSVLTDASPPSDPSRTLGEGMSSFSTLSFLPYSIPAGAPLCSATLLRTAAATGGDCTPFATGGILRQPIRGAGRFNTVVGIPTSLNFGGVKCRFLSFPPLIQKPAKPESCVSKCFDWLLRLFVHDEQPSERNIGNDPKPFGDFKYVGR